MRGAVAIGLALFTVAGFHIEGPAASRELSDKEIDQIICDGLLSAVKEKERTRKFKIAQRKSRKERTRSEQVLLDVVQIFRDQYKKEKCG